MLTPLSLDFVHTRYRYRWLAWVLLLLGLACATWATHRHTQYVAQQADLRRQLAEKQAALRKVAPPPKSAEEEKLETQRSADIARRLQLPWHNLFVSLENATVENVALLQIMPDPGRRVVRIAGEAKSVADALAYVRRLQRSSALSKARLSSYAAQQQPTGDLVRFVVEAEWILP